MTTRFARLAGAPITRNEDGSVSAAVVRARLNWPYVAFWRDARVSARAARRRTRLEVGTRIRDSRTRQGRRAFVPCAVSVRDEDEPRGVFTATRGSRRSSAGRIARARRGVARDKRRRALVPGGARGRDVRDGVGRNGVGRNETKRNDEAAPGRRRLRARCENARLRRPRRRASERTRGVMPRRSSLSGTKNTFNTFGYVSIARRASFYEENRNVAFVRNRGDAANSMARSSRETFSRTARLEREGIRKTYPIRSVSATARRSTPSDRVRQHAAAYGSRVPRHAQARAYDDSISRQTVLRLTKGSSSDEYVLADEEPLARARPIGAGSGITASRKRGDSDASRWRRRRRGRVRRATTPGRSETARASRDGVPNANAARERAVLVSSRRRGTPRTATRVRAVRARSATRWRPPPEGAVSRARVGGAEKASFGTRSGSRRWVPGARRRHRSWRRRRAVASRGRRGRCRAAPPTPTSRTLAACARIGAFLSDRGDEPRFRPADEHRPRESWRRCVVWEEGEGAPWCLATRTRAGYR